MASAAEQLASNINLSAFAKADELKKRLLFTLGALIIYRLGTYIPLPGVDPNIFSQAFQTQSGGILGMFNLFAGGAVERMAIFALNIMPYISASIIVQLLTAVYPHFEQLKKEGEAGRKQLNQYTRYGTVALAAFQGYGIALGMESTNFNGVSAVADPGWFFRLTTVVTLVGSTMFLLWLGEQITARGVGNGVSLIIFAGIVSELPRSVGSILELGRTGQLSIIAIALIFAGAMGIVAFVVFMERSQRRLLIQYPRRQQARGGMAGGEKSHMPLKLNTAGVIPPIFASSLLLLPLTISGFAGQAAGGPEWVQTLLALTGRGQPLYLLLYGALIVFFCFVYTSIIFNPADVADNLKKYGGYIQGYRPGQRTAEYIDYVLTRLTVIGAAYLAFVCLLPEFIFRYFSGVPVALGGTSLLIAVTVTMDTVAQIQGHLLAHQYEGLIKKSRLRGGRR